MKIDETNADNGNKMYLDKTNKLLGTYVTLRRINKNKVKYCSIQCTQLYAPLIMVIRSLDNDDPITKHYNIANTFNNYFASIAETMKKV